MAELWVVWLLPTLDGWMVGDKGNSSLTATPAKANQRRHGPPSDGKYRLFSSRTVFSWNSLARRVLRVILGSEEKSAGNVLQRRAMGTAHSLEQVQQLTLGFGGYRVTSRCSPAELAQGSWGWEELALLHRSGEG